jgi:tetratricopeptide (TPR) repeat protein
MSLWIFWLCLAVLCSPGLASDIPFVFGENTNDFATYSSAQFEEFSSSLPELVGVPEVNSPSDNEVLEIFATGISGGESTPKGKMKPRVVKDLKDELNKKVEPDNPMISERADLLASKYPGDLRIEQICEIYYYLKYGDRAKAGWKYVRDTRGIDSWNYANQSLTIGDKTNCVGLGDCDDFAILMAAFAEAIGGATRIILANNNSIGGHAYTEVYVGRINDSNYQVVEIIKWLQEESNTSKIYGHLNTTTRDVWLNLDWGSDEKGNFHPGGPFFPGDRHDILLIREIYKSIPIRKPEAINRPPRYISLTPDKISPQEEGSVVIWTAQAADHDKDKILYRFLLNGYPATNWINENSWIWTTDEADIGYNLIEVQARDGKHSGPNGFDTNTTVNFSITERDVSSKKQLINKGNALYLQGKYEEAIQAYDIAIELDPKYAEAWYNKGNALRNQGRYNEAIQAYNTTIEINSRHAGAWNNKGLALKNQGKYEEAIQAYDIAIQLDPKYTGAWNNKGNALYLQGKCEEAIQAYDIAIQLDPKSTEAWDNKGNALYSQSKYSGAIEAYDIAIELDPKYAKAWYNKGNALYSQGRYEEAIQAYDIAIELDPKYAKAWYNKGNALNELGRITEAATYFARANELGSNS